MLFEALYSIYLYFRFPANKVEKIQFSNCTQPSVRVPKWEADIIVNDKINLPMSHINTLIYSKIKNAKKVTINYYKTDGRGNYIFY